MYKDITKHSHLIYDILHKVRIIYKKKYNDKYYMTFEYNKNKYTIVSNCEDIRTYNTMRWYIQSGYFM